jgi:hypothetical protein
LFLALLFAITSTARAQDEEIPIEAAPPPKILLRSDAERLRAESAPKDRARVALEILSERLRKAESFAAAGDNEAMLTELGSFAAVIDTALKDLLRYDERGNQPLSSLKRFDLGLRALFPRLEVLRRSVPYTHEYYLKYLMKQVQNAREKAMRPLFDYVDSEASNL